MKQHNHEKVSQKLQQDLHNLLSLILPFLERILAAVRLYIRLCVQHFLSFIPYLH